MFLAACGLYGERADAVSLDALHIEPLDRRSRQHGWDIRPHGHHGLLQLFWIQQGEGLLYLGDAPMRLSAGQLAVLPPLTVHGFIWQPGVDGLVVTLSATSIRPLTLTGPHVVTPTAEAAAELQACLLAAQREFDTDRPGRSVALAAHAHLVALAVLRAAPSVSPRPAESGRTLVEKFLERVEQHFADHLPVQAHAAALNVSATHLTRLCRQALGRSAQSLLQDRLMLEARRTLAFTALSVAEVAYGLGFDDPAYFSRFFARHQGCSPTRYRERQWQEG